MSPRTGRPKSENPKSFHFNVRLNEAENAELEAYCRKNNATKAEVARQGIRRILEEDKK